ncbi:zinc finger protein 271-like [Pseudomyrmex gracilis]|uniref:zinc finger protein 271-like n=1 Tax=Pseudomyrmex gracilis TaxID=219809 RepID=UPI000995750D|nr:zinc finger protein 271-like [Pseudomyrmex gracilis]
MEAHESEQYVTFSLDGVHDTVQENIISHEEICEPVECVLQDELTNAVSTDMETQEDADKILREQSDEEDENTVEYPIYIKEEEQQQYMSGDDESMAVEALRQLGGMYPSFEGKKLSCPTCKSLFTQEEMVKHRSTCTESKLSCTTCGEKFERKIDLNNHMVCHQVDRPHACRTCGNLFRSKSSLNAHMLQAHQVERPYKCTVCGSDFLRPSSLSNHMKIHSYVPGRGIAQSQRNLISQSAETFRKWPENASDSQNISHTTSSSVQTIHNYDVCQVQWPTSTYNFQNEQSIVTTMSNQQEKIETLQEFTVIPNDEISQFAEYTDQNNINNSVNTTQQYNLTINSFNTPDGIVKVQSLIQNNTNRDFKETETNNSKQYINTNTCKHCGVYFARVQALVSHEKTHKEWINPVECQYCERQFQDGNHLATHQTTCAKKIIQNKDKNGSNNKLACKLICKHACSECGKKFPTKQKMYRHKWIHRKKTYSCEVCGLQFEKQSELDEHRLSAHPGDSPFTCTECGKSFVSRQGLWEHGRTHAGSPAHFQCDTCSKTFSSRQGYLIHNRTHTGERPYGCKFCWKSFRDGGTLRKHERIHTGERPHVCPICTRAFNQKVVLREHVRWVHAAGKNETEKSDPPYPCPLCGALNQDRDELCAHIVKHSDQMIAEAKAKNVNISPKIKPTKKKAKTSSCGIDVQTKEDTLENLISKTDQAKAILSITDTSDNPDDLNVMNEKQNNAFVVVTTDKRSDGFISISELKHSNIEFIVESKEDENIHVLQMDRNPRDPLNIITMGKQNNTAHIVSTVSVDSALDETIRSNNMSAMQLIQSSKQNNTLNIISKQNEALPVLTIPNPQNHDNYSSQIIQVNTTNMPIDIVTQDEENHTQNEQDSLIQEETSHVIQVVPYQDDSDGEDFICGICAEGFDDKESLKTHIKIHI